jgi:chromosome segregation ATPase
MLSPHQENAVNGELITLTASVVEHVCRKGPLQTAPYVMARERAESLAEQNREIQALLALKTYEVESLEEKVKALEHTLVTKSKSLEELREREAHAVTKLKDWETEFEARLTNLQLKEERKLCDAQRAIERCTSIAAKASLLNMQGGYAKARQEFAERVERDKLQHDYEMELLQQTSTEIAARARAFQEEIARLTDSEEEKGAQLAELREAIKEASARSDGLSAQLAETQAELQRVRSSQELETAKEQVDMLTKALEAASKKREAYDRAIEKEKTVCEALDAMQKENAELSAREGQLKADLAEMAQQLSLRESEVNRLSCSAREAIGKQTEIERLNRDQEDLIRRCQTQTTEMNQLQSIIVALRGEVATLTAHVSVLANEKQLETESRSRLEEELTRLSQSHSERGRQLEEIDAELRSVKESSGTQIQGLTQKLSLTGAMFSDVSALVTRLRADAIALLPARSLQLNGDDSDDVFR